MKQLRKILPLALVVFLPFTASAQRIHKGRDASILYQNAEIVRTSIFSDLPSFIKFREDGQFDIDRLAHFMANKVKLDSKVGFNLVRQEPDNIGHVHYRYQQTYNNLPIEDAIWIAHTNNDKVYSLNGLIYSKIVTPLTASLSEETALEKAKEYVGATVYKWELPEEEKHLKWESEDETATYFPKGELVYVSTNNFNANSFRLAYKFDIYAHAPVSRGEIYVDANSGKILRENKTIHHVDEVGTAETVYSGDRDITADSFEGEYRLRDGSRGDGVRTFDLNEGTSYGAAVDFTDDDNHWDNVNPQQDEYATDAHWGAEMTYDYYFDIHGRNSIDATGFQLNSYVHYSSGFVNAFWDGSRMTYGDGSGSYTPLTSIDIAGHEVSHGLTTFTADLIYAAESGALNESFSDIFGSAIERFARPGDWNWLIGEDIGSAFRSMSNPNFYGDPDTYFGDFWAPLDGPDSGGVHSNSGVQNFWFYLLTTGGSGTNDIGDAYDVESVGIEASSAIAFRNLTVYLTPSSPFDDARFFSIQSAIDLYDDCSFEVEQTAEAWYAVGVGEGGYEAVALADFSTPDTLGCALPHMVTFTNESESGATYTWDFGDGTTSDEENPVHTYTEAGTFTVSLSIDGLCGADDIIYENLIVVDLDMDCIVILPEDGTYNTQIGCTGTVYDSGGPDAPYGANEDAIVTISPTGASTVDLTFPFFDVEAGDDGTCNYDYVEIFDGPDIYSPSLGRFCNTIPPTAMSSTGPSITILFNSDPGLEEDGFEINWSCNMPGEAPIADFFVNDEISCTGTVYFTDNSSNAPISWLWNFGDGSTSTEQNPTHLYDAEGVYTVSLTASNVVGENTYTEASFITVNYADAPSVTGDENCPTETATLLAAGTGTLKWYTSPTGLTSIHEGASYTTESLTSTTTYYVEDDQYDSPGFVGPVDNSFGGGSFYNGDQHLVFNSPNTVILKSVKVYADGSRDRIIELRDNTGEVIESRTVYIEDGEQTVILDMVIPAGTNMQLGTQFDSDQGLFRNNTGIPAFPYTLPESVEITSSSAGDEYYYFFYNWEIHTYSCTSERVPVVAEVLPESDVTISDIQPVCIQSGPIALTASEAGGTWSSSCATCIDPTTGVFDPAGAGEGTWTVTYDIDGTCSYVNTNTVSVIDCLGLEDETIENISIFPNPTSGIVNITMGSISEGKLVITDVVGKTVYETVFTSNAITLDLSDYNARGTYFIKFINKEGSLITTKKIVKQ